MRGASLRDQTPEPGIQLRAMRMTMDAIAMMTNTIRIGWPVTKVISSPTQVSIPVKNEPTSVIRELRV